MSTFAFAPHDDQILVLFNIEDGSLEVDLAPNSSLEPAYTAIARNSVFLYDEFMQVIGLEIGPHDEDDDEIIDALTNLREAIHGLVMGKPVDVELTGIQGFPEGK